MADWMNTQAVAPEAIHQLGRLGLPDLVCWTTIMKTLRESCLSSMAGLQVSGVSDQRVPDIDAN
jgi:hypothetical protein